MPGTQQEQRYHVTADIEIRAPPGIEFRLEDIDLVKQGGFRDAEGAMDLALGSTLGEIRKLALASDPLHALVRGAEEQEDQTPAVIRLHATPRLLARLAAAASTTPGEPTAEDLAENQAWLRAALSFDEYEPEALILLSDEPAWRK